MKISEANVSMLLGLLVVVGVAGAIWKYLPKQVQLPREKISAAATEKIALSPTPKVQGEYVVERGDSLWKISTKAYGSGYKWVNLYLANKQQIGTNANKLMIGTKLVLPADRQKATIEAYKVQKGDNLWKIAKDKCGNGFDWIRIAQASLIKTPNLIYPGQKLKIECR